MDNLDSKEYCTIYLVRHGESEDNVNSIVAGHRDRPLTAHGRDQIARTRDRLKDIIFDAVYSSDLQRTQETAQILTEKKLALKTKEALRERFWGRFEGKHSSEFRDHVNQLYGGKQVSERDMWYTTYDAGIETYDEMVTRALVILREIAAANIGKTVLVAFHGACIRSLLVRFGIGKMMDFPPGSIKNGAHVRLMSDGVEFFICDVVGIHKEGKVYVRNGHKV
ncbi:MAG TPA: histidine phosphatase family protein [Patescibacteria group bacterium]|nr:histidine phosphatase family protein [Patescibacteria group bacterium]